MNTINRRLAYWRTLMIHSEDSVSRATARLHILELLDERRENYPTETN